jgi:hypothetical protein
MRLLARMLNFEGRDHIEATAVEQNGNQRLECVLSDQSLWVHEIKHDGYRLMVRRDGCHRGGTKKKPPLKVGQRRLILAAGLL